MSVCWFCHEAAQIVFFIAAVTGKYFLQTMRMTCVSDGCQPFRTQVISYPGHFVPTLVISYLLFGHFVPSNNHFVPRSFCTQVISYPFGHFVPRSTKYEMTILWSIRTQVISYPFWSFRIHFGHFIPSKDGRMDGWIDERTDRRALIEMTN